MSEIRIEHKAVTLFGADTTYEHLYLVFVDDDGHEFVIRGGPSYDLPPWGIISMEIGTPIADFEDARPSTAEARAEHDSFVLDLGDRNPELLWKSMLDVARDLADAELDYDLADPNLRQNSNSVVAGILERFGLSVSDYEPFNQHSSDFLGYANTLRHVAYTLDGATEYDPNTGLVSLWYDHPDILVGGDQSDVIRGGLGADKLYGGEGDDFLFANEDTGWEILQTNPPYDAPAIPEAAYYYTPGQTDFTTWDDNARDYLAGGNGFDRYFVGAGNLGSGLEFDMSVHGYGWTGPESWRSTFYNYVDVIYDIDGEGEIYVSQDTVLGVGKWFDVFQGAFTLEQDPVFDHAAYQGDDGYLFLDRYTNPDRGLTYDVLVGVVETELYLANFVIEGYFNGAFGIFLSDYTPGTIEGTYNADFIQGSGGSDTINGGDGNDHIDGHDGNDIINGGNGDDILSGGAGGDTINGNLGNDTADYSSSAGGVNINLVTNSISGGDAAGDILTSIESIWGSQTGDDTIVGISTGGTYMGLGGNDTLTATAGVNILDGGEGDDLITGGTGDDAIFDNFGANIIDGGDGTDTYYVFGIEADYSLYIITGGIQIEGPQLLSLVTNTEFLVFEDVAGIQTAINISDFISQNINLINGTSSDDYLSGTDGNDAFEGNGGSDTFYGGLGDDIFNGNPANYSQVDYDGHAVDYSFSLNGDGTVSVTNGIYGSDTLVDIDGVWFINESEWYSVGDLLPAGTVNTINGTSGDDYLSGTNFNDEFFGGDGSDTFYGGLGNDIYHGGDAGYNQVDYDGYAVDYTFTLNADGSATAVNVTYGTDILHDIGGIWFTGEGQWYSIWDLYPAGTINAINGTSGNDYLVGSTINDEFFGGDGSDTFYGDLGDDIYHGGDAGYNQVDYDGYAADYMFTLNGDGTTKVENSTYGTDTLEDIGGIWFIDEGQWYDINSLYAA